MYQAIWSNLRFRKYDHFGEEGERLNPRHDLVPLKSIARLSAEAPRESQAFPIQISGSEWIYQANSVFLMKPYHPGNYILQFMSHSGPDLSFSLYLFAVTGVLKYKFVWWSPASR